MALILFDIDGTLFDPEKFGRLIRAEFTKILKIEEEELIRANADYYAALETTTDFNPREIVSFLATRFKVSRDPLDQIFWENDEIYSGALYHEADHVLKKLSEKNTLGIFSQGNEELQARKLKGTGIKKYFRDENVYIYSRKLTDEAIELLPRDATVIDNHHDVAITLKKFVNVVWINRKSEESDPQVRTIHSLEELVQ